MILTKLIKTRFFRLLICLLALLMLGLNGQTVLAYTQSDLNSIYSNTPYYKPDGNSCKSNPSSTAASGGLDDVLKAIAQHESGGNPKAVNPAGAAGKYQFFSKYWQSSATAVYPPGLQYSSAEQAPESVQDAVEYLRFIPVYNNVAGDPFATAIYNYWPALYQVAHANHNDPRLNFAPAGNGGLTIKAFGDSIVDIITSGKSKNIPMLYSQAPDFQTWLAKAGGPPSGSAAASTTPTPISSSSSCGTSNGAVANNIAQTAINLSWPTNHGTQAKPEYTTAITQYNPSAPFGGADCGAFVATVMRASGADPNYPLVGTINQERYVAQHPEKYDLEFGITSTSGLQPGDILIINEGAHLGANGELIVPSTGNSGSGHTVIYIGPQPAPITPGFNEASASFKERMANLGVLSLTDGRGMYMRARLKS